MSFSNPCARCGSSDTTTSVEHYQIGTIGYCAKCEHKALPPEVWDDLYERRAKLAADQDRKNKKESAAAKVILAKFVKKPRPLRASDNHAYINGHSYCPPSYQEGNYRSLGFAAGPQGGTGTPLNCPGCLYYLYPAARPKGMREPK